jgi:DNA-binding transcriptional regulator YiaG
MEERKDGKKIIYETVNESLNLSDGITVTLNVTAGEFQAFDKLTRGKHLEDGPDVLKVVAPAKTTIKQHRGTEVIGTMTLNSMAGRSFKTTFAPGPEIGCLRFLIGGELYEIGGMEFTPEDWPVIKGTLEQRNMMLGLAVPEPKKGAIPCPGRADFFHVPGRLFDTPRNATGKGKQEDLPAINRWYQQTAFNRTVGMAAAALTKTESREAILDWQEATVAEVADLVFCRSEEGTPARGQNREDILKAFEALRAIPVPIVKIDWKQVGTDRNPRWVKEYKLRTASLLQSYGAVFVEKATGKRVDAGDPGYKKDLKKGKADRRKTMKELVAMNPADSILHSFPADRFTLTGFEWRWNTDIAEDFICPQVALDEKNRPRLKLTKGRHIEGSRFINLHRRYFIVQKHLREAGSTYAPRLLDLIVSEKTHITSHGKGAVWIEIEAPKVIKWLGLWSEYENRPKHVLEDHVAPAIMLLIKEKVMLPESWLMPQKDKNEDRRKNPYYRWKVAELWTTVALVPEDEAKEIEDELVKQAEEAESKDQNDTLINQSALPGIIEDAQPIPSGADIRAAREAAGMTLRRFAEYIAGPDFSTWSRYETGKPIRVKNISPEVWQRVRKFIAQNKGKKG